MEARSEQAAPHCLDHEAFSCKFLFSPKKVPILKAALQLRRQGSAMPDSSVSLIIFALLAVFVIWKLRSVLGTRTGHEQPPYEPPFESRKDAASPSDKSDYGRILRLPTVDQRIVAAAPGQSNQVRTDGWASFAKPGSDVWTGLDRLASADSNFDPTTFLKGAASAYEMIVAAFAAGDAATLERLLSREIFGNFESAINERNARGERMETTIVAVETPKFEDVRLTDGLAQVTLRFETKTISNTRAQTGEIVEGSADRVADHVDLWTFARPVASLDPNWRLVATQPAS